MRVMTGVRARQAGLWLLAGRRWRQPGRPRGSIAGSGICVLAILMVTAPAFAASGAPAGPASSLPSGRPAPVPAVPDSATFVGQPRIAPEAAGVRQACATPTKPGQMACMALLPAHARQFAADASQPAGPSYGPAQLQNAYGLSAAASTPGGGETVAVVDAYNDPKAASDLAAYRTAFALPACTIAAGCLAIENQFGGTSLPRSDRSGGWELEESLDLDMVSAICPNCKIILVEANSASIADLARAEETASRSGAEAVSNSWGSGAEFTGENVYDTDFYAPGVAITAAGGDNGYGAQYPSVSPYVTSVGGTSLTGILGAWHQSAWAGTGSGCAQLEPKPSWQTADASAPGGCRNRTANDLSAEANPNPGVFAYDTVQDTSGGAIGWNSVGGTSVGTPIIAAAYALADIVAGGPHKALLPFTFPASYPYQNTSDFTDVKTGSNGSCEPSRGYLCRARAGYDGPTGVGTPDGTAGLTGPAGGQVTVLGPGTLVYQAGAKVYHQLDVQPGSSAPAFSTAGLPGGLVLGSDDVIKGTAPSVPGVHKVTVTASVSGLAPGSATFFIVVIAKIKISHPAAGQVRLGGGPTCLTDAHNSAANGTPADIGPCKNEPAQDWEFIPGAALGSPGALKIHGKCLTIRTGSQNGARASIQPCTGGPRQQWSYQASGRLRNAATDRCLAVQGAATSGKHAVAWSCTGRAMLIWKLPAAPVLSGLAGRCLTDPADRAAAGTRAVIARCGSGASQRWTAAPNGTLVINGKCIAVHAGSKLDGAGVELARCGSGPAEKWLRGPYGQLINVNSGRCLADPGNSLASGTKLIQDDCYSEPGEIWVIS